MEKFFSPDSIAVVGASPRKNGRSLIRNLVYGFKGRIFPINPGYDEIEGLKCYASLKDIPEPVDLAIVLVPAKAVPKVMEGCLEKKITRVMIESAGFAEVGPEGRALQDRCIEIARKGGIRVWGPNCMGLIDTHQRHLFTFMDESVYAKGLIAGRISLVVQSGMLSASFFHRDHEPGPHGRGQDMLHRQQAGSGRVRFSGISLERSPDQSRRPLSGIHKTGPSVRRTGGPAQKNRWCF